MSIVDRVKRICLSPASEWPVIAGESASAGGLMSGYAVPLMAIGAVAGFIGGSLVGMTVPLVGTYRVPISTGLTLAVFTFVVGLCGVFVLSLIINALAPTFGGSSNSLNALKVAVYSYTPAWVAGILQIIPGLSLLGLFAGLYAIYLLYLGLPVLMKNPADKAIAYTAVVVVCAIAISVVIGLLGAAMVGVGSGLAGLSTATGSSSSNVQFDKNSPLGKLEELGKKLEESNKKMAAAEKSGDQNAQTAAAFEGLGTLLGGGRRVEPVATDALKPFVPDTFAGLQKESGSIEQSGLGGIMVTVAEAIYSDGGHRRVTLEITDSGGASGLMSLAGWAGVQGEREDASGVERTRKVDGRIVHEKTTRDGSADEFGIVLGDRFVVSAKGSAVSAKDLQAAVMSLDLRKLESMKDVGVQK